MTPAHRTSVLGRLRDVAVGLLSLLTLLAATVGLPVLLFVVTRGLLPHHAPTGGDVKGLFTRQDNGSAAIAAIAVVAWLGWAAFALSVLLEIPARLSGKAVRPVPLLGWSQRAASGLLAGVALLLPAAPGMAATGTALPHLPATVAAVSTANPGPGAPSVLQAAGHIAAHRATVDYTIRDHGESLMTIAGHQLGDEQRWHEIAEHNNGRTMPGGQAFDAAHTLTLPVGWTLKLPADAGRDDQAVPAEAAAAAGTPGAHAATETVHSGDTLWALAQRDYGDGADYPRIFQANEGKPQPHGLPPLTDPDLIYPGQVLTVPDAAPAPSATTTAPPAAGNATTPPGSISTPPTSPPKTGSATSPATTQAAPGTAVSSPGAGAVTAGPSAAASAPTAAATAPPTSDPVDAYDPAADAPSPTGSWDSSAVVLGVCGLTAAGLLTLLAVKRSRQQRSRRLGRRIRMPKAAAGGAGVRLKLTATAAPAELADRALRTLAAACAAGGRPVPPLDAVVVDETGLHLHLAEPQGAAPAPFTGDGQMWTCPAEADLLDAEACADVPAPYPTLVAIGDIGGGQVLIDLESTHLLAVDGDGADVLHVLRALLAELATSTRADELTVVTVGLEELAGALGGPRLHAAGSAMAALHDVNDHAASTMAALADLGLPDIRTARTAAVEAPNWTPQILLCTRALDEDETTLLIRILTNYPGAPIAVIVPAGQVADAWPAATVLPAGPGPIAWPGVQTPVTVQRIDDGDYLQILDHLRTANDVSDVPADPWPTGPDDQKPSADPELVWKTWEQAAAGADPSITAVWPLATASAFASPASVPAVMMNPWPTLPAGAADGALPGAAPQGSVTWIREPTDQAGLQGSGLGNGPAVDDLQDDDPVDGDAPDDQDAAQGTPDTAAWNDAVGGFTNSSSQDGSAVDVAVGWDSNWTLEDAPASASRQEQADDEAGEPDEDDDADEGWNEDADEGFAEEGGQAEHGVFGAPSAATPTPQVAPLRGHPQIRVLGTVELVGVEGPIEDSRRERLAELAAFIALHPGVNHDLLQTSLWPNGGAASTRNAHISRLRTWFGHHPDGTKYLPEYRGGFRFHDSVSCDWTQFQKLSRAAALRGPDGVADLETALRLVRGKPMSGIAPSRYGWSDTLQQTMIAEVADAAVNVAEARLSAGNPRAALEAAVLGLSAAPENERLHRCRFMAAYRLGDDEEIERTATQLEDYLTGCDLDMEPQTREMYGEILRQRRARQASTG